MSTVKLNIDGTDYACTPVPSPISKTGLHLVPVSADAKVQVAMLDALTNWLSEHDDDTTGKAEGVTSYPVLIGGRQAREFTNKYEYEGGYRYHVTYGEDTIAKNFVYAGDLYFPSVQGLAQMELDNNQVTADGATYIFGCQCDDNSGSWDITKTENGNCHWLPTAFKGSPQSFPLNRWIHFEIASHRDDAGNITYDAIFWDGVTMPIDTTLRSSLQLGWGPAGVMLVNLQIGGAGASGSIVMYGNNLQVARW